MKKDIVLAELAFSSLKVSVDNKLKERKFTEDNSTTIKSKMDAARAFIKEHGLADVTQLKKRSAK